MGYQVTLSPSARRDLEEIVRYISLDSPQRAIDFGLFLVSQTKRLSEYRKWGRRVPEFADDEIREIIVRSYRIIYRVDDRKERVEVVRFWHGARGDPSLG